MRGKGVGLHCVSVFVCVIVGVWEGLRKVLENVVENKFNVGRVIEFVLNVQ